MTALQMDQKPLPQKYQLLGCRLHGEESLLGTSPLEIRFPENSPVICTGPNGSGKSLITFAIRAVLLPSASEDLVRDLADAGLRHVELDIQAESHSLTLTLDTENGDRNCLMLNDSTLNSSTLNGFKPDGEPAPALELPPEGLLDKLYLIADGDCSLPAPDDLPKIGSILKKPVEQELAVWRERKRALVGDDHQGGRLAEAEDGHRTAEEDLDRQQRLTEALEQGKRRQKELNQILTGMITAGAVFKAEREEIERKVGLAERGNRLENWLTEIREQSSTVEKLREEHFTLQEKLDQLSARFRGVPDRFPELLDEYGRFTERRSRLNTQRDEAQSVRERTIEEISEIERQLASLEKPDIDGMTADRNRLHSEILDTESELVILLRDRIKLLRQREGVEHKLQSEFASFGSLDADTLESLRDYANSPASAKPVSSPVVERSSQYQEKTEDIRRNINEWFRGFDRTSDRAGAELKELFQTRAYLKESSQKLEALQARRHELESTNLTRSRVVAAGIGAAAVGIPVGILAAWDIGLFSALVGSGAAMLGHQYSSREREANLDAVITEQEETQERWREALNNKASLENSLGPLAEETNLEDAESRLADYRRLKDELDSLPAETGSVEGTGDATPEGTVTSPPTLLPEGFEKCSPSDLRERLHNYDELIRQRVEFDHRWKEYEEPGERAERIAAFETRVSRKKREIEELEAARRSREEEYESRSAILKEKHAELRAAMPDDEGFRKILEDLEQAEKKLAWIARETGGALLDADPAAIRDDWLSLQSMRGRQRELKDELSARLAVEEIRSRQAILADELNEVTGKLIDIDPLYRTQGSASEELQKYSEQLEALSGKIADHLRATEETREEIERLNLRDLENELAKQPDAEGLSEVLDRRRRELEDVEQQASATEDILSALEHELQDINQGVKDALEEAVNRKLLALDSSLGRLQLTEDGWLLEQVSGSRRRVRSLSRGTAELMKLIVACSVLELTGSAEQTFVIWDDALSNLDAIHAEFVFGMLRSLSEQRQVILLTRDQNTGEWGLQIELPSMRGQEVED